MIVDSPNGKREMEILSLSTIHDEIDGPKEAQAPEFPPARQP